MPSRTTRKPTARTAALDLDKFEQIHQVGGIRTGTLDHPNPNGGQAVRVAHVDTGSGLRFVVALDRGGDIVEAFFNRYSLTYLSPNGYTPPSHAYHHDRAWLNSWPGGLVTSCGPQYIGQPRVEDDTQITLHGHHSNTPAALESCINPEPAAGRHDMTLTLVVRDTRFQGAVVEVRRQIQCTLGKPEIRIHDRVTNRGSTRIAHNWLYHINFGYPLLDKGTRFIYQGRCMPWLPHDKARQPKLLSSIKRAPDALAEHIGGAYELGIQPPADAKGWAHVGIINAKLNLGVEITHPVAELPRVWNWQQFTPRGAYVSALEPYSGSLLGKADDPDPRAAQYLQPGQTRDYHVTLRVHEGRTALAALAKYDGKLLLD